MTFSGECAIDLPQFAFGINVRDCFIQQHHLRTPSTRNGDTRLLSTGLERRIDTTCLGKNHAL
ncbi:hypothetical protein BSU04_05070 [Caballeronia sordidicola]|uniref:Uncharacterized protein n=1 Tax=Caballeronia sordidicola TaxID=196367 RepID=A0A226X8K0_CABSO|nr:hypothetical protein BSU04_05070 [Caballeronia sordidicola]